MQKIQNLCTSVLTIVALRNTKTSKFFSHVFHGKTLKKYFQPNIVTILLTAINIVFHIIYIK